MPQVVRSTLGLFFVCEIHSKHGVYYSQEEKYTNVYYFCLLIINGHKKRPP